MKNTSMVATNVIVCYICILQKSKYLSNYLVIENDEWQVMGYNI
jgi:hypothetical protein